MVGNITLTRWNRKTTTTYNEQLWIHGHLMSGPVTCSSLLFKWHNYLLQVTWPYSWTPGAYIVMPPLEPAISSRLCFPTTDTSIRRMSAGSMAQVPELLSPQPVPAAAEPFLASGSIQSWQLCMPPSILVHSDSSNKISQTEYSI